MLRTIVLVFVTIFSTMSFAQSTSSRKQVEPEQNLFVAESPKPQGQRELQAAVKTMVGPRQGHLGVEGVIEYGITDRLWFGPKASYGIAPSDDGNEHQWDVRAGGGYNFIADEWFLLSFLLDAGYGSEKFVVSPSIALFKSVYDVGIDLSFSVAIYPQAKGDNIEHEVSLSLFTNWRPVSPLLEMALAIKGHDINPLVAPGLMLITVPRMEFGLALEMPLRDIRDSTILISLLREFDT